MEGRREADGGVRTVVFGISAPATWLEDAPARDDVRQAGLPMSVTERGALVQKLDWRPINFRNDNKMEDQPSQLPPSGRIQQYINLSMPYPRLSRATIATVCWLLLTSICCQISDIFRTAHSIQLSHMFDSIYPFHRDHEGHPFASCV